jgi:ribonuclease HI
METVIAYTSGSAHGNPGPAGVGVYGTTVKGTVVCEVKKAIGNADTNFAAYYAVMLALDTLKQIYGPATKTIHFEFRLDSELVKKQLNSEYQINEPGLVPMFIEIHNQCVVDFPNITLTHVSDAENKEAHRLAEEAVNGK